MAASVPRPENDSIWKYSPLKECSDQMRLLALLPGSGDETIRCEQASVSLESATGFEALSYVWGDPNVTSPILIDGKPFQVTANLHSALQYLRPQEKPRTLWIDALCIDQGNDVEKSTQVQLMGDIYRQASRVLAWLGAAEDDSDLVMDFLALWDQIRDGVAQPPEMEEPLPLQKPITQYSQDPKKSCKIVVDRTGYASVINDGDCSNGPRIRIAVPDLLTCSGEGSVNAVNVDLIRRSCSDQIEMAKKMFFQQETLLLPSEKRCQQCDDHQGLCW